MKSLIDDIKAQIKDKKGELAKLEKALAALEPEKTVPKAKATSTTTARATTSTSAPADSRSLPDQIIATLADFDDLAADNLAQRLRAPLNQVRTVCSRLAREGRISVRKLGRTALYSGLKSEKPASDNPFTETN